MIFKKEYLPRIGDFDRFYNLSPEAALSIFEDAGNLHSMAVARGVIEDSRNGLAWIITEWNYRFCRQPENGEKLIANTWTFGRLPSYAVNRNYRVTDENGNDILKCEGKFAIVDTDAGKPIKLTEELMAPYQPEEIYVFERGEFPRLREPKDPDGVTEVGLRKADTDYNGHLHNTKFISVAAQAVPDDFAKNVRDIQISYRTQLCGVKAYVRSKFEDGRYVMGIYDESDTLCALVSMK
ncbi:MAG: hypothetical protein IJT91_04500 [Clostridia bacterium]|nr:hypothetical protein [Clostridia bacterium]